MGRKQRVQISISIFLLLVAGVFVWQYSKNQEQKDASVPESFQETLFGGGAQDEEVDQDEGEETLDAKDPLNVPDTDVEAKKKSAYVVDQAVCDNECALYQNDQEALAYCQAVCGFAPTEGGRREAPESCEDRTDTAKDICYRDKAVAESDPSWCEKIIDHSLRKSCHNRLAEEYFD